VHYEREHVRSTRRCYGEELQAAAAALPADGAGDQLKSGGRRVISGGPMAAFGKVSRER
jgi:hypothetical protein